jgi:hypothetical protein
LSLAAGDAGTGQAQGGQAVPGNGSWEGTGDSARVQVNRRTRRADKGGGQGGRSRTGPRRLLLAGNAELRVWGRMKGEGRENEELESCLPAAAAGRGRGPLLPLPGPFVLFISGFRVALTSAVLPASGPKVWLYGSVIRAYMLCKGRSSRGRGVVGNARAIMGAIMGVIKGLGARLIDNNGLT